MSDAASIAEGATAGVCGLALRYAKMPVPANRLHTEREPISSFATFHTDDVTPNSETH